MTSVQADVWVLTEAHTQVAPGPNYELIAHSTRTGAEDPGESWVAVWSRVGGSPVRVSDEDRASAIELPQAGAHSLIVYGLVLPWLGSRWRNVPAARGQAFVASLAVHASDWATLSERGRLCVAGDFNQDLLSERHYYGSKGNRAALRAALATASLACPTADPIDAVWTHTKGAAAGVDHICVGSALSILPEDRDCVWPAPERRGADLTDHFGVSVRVAAS